MGGKYDKPISIGGPGGKDGIVYAGGTPGFDEKGPGFTPGGPPISDFQVDIDKINALTPDDINPMIPFPDLDIDVGDIDMGEYGDVAYKGGSKDFDFTGGGLGNISLPVKGGVSKPKPKPKSKKKPRDMIFAGARPKRRGTARMGSRR
jgi:hypothetical protein